MQLRQAVHGALEQVGPRVLEPIPAWIVIRVLEPEVGPEIDHGRARLEVFGDERRGRPMREGEEHRVDVGERALDRVAGRRQVWVDAPERIAVALAPLQSDDRHVRVAAQEPDQLGTHVPRRADDPDPDPFAVPGRRAAARRRAGPPPAAPPRSRRWSS